MYDQLSVPHPAPKTAVVMLQGHCCWVVVMLLPQRLFLPTQQALAWSPRSHLKALMRLVQALPLQLWLVVQ